MIFPIHFQTAGKVTSAKIHKHTVKRFGIFVAILRHPVADFTFAVFRTFALHFYIVCRHLSSPNNNQRQKDAYNGKKFPYLISFISYLP